MAKVGVINLGLNPEGEYFENFLYNIKDTLNDTFWDKKISVISHDHINPTEIAKLDTLVLSPEYNVPIGLPDHERAIKDPHLGSLYTLVHTAVQAGIPMIGSNGGHQVMNLAYNWAIGRIPPESKEDYKKFPDGQGKGLMNLSNTCSTNCWISSCDRSLKPAKKSSPPTCPRNPGRDILSACKISANRVIARSPCRKP